MVRVPARHAERITRRSTRPVRGIGGREGCASRRGFRVEEAIGKVGRRERGVSHGRTGPSTAGCGGGAWVCVTAGIPGRRGDRESRTAGEGSFARADRAVNRRVRGRGIGLTDSNDLVSSTTHLFTAIWAAYATLILIRLTRGHGPGRWAV